MLFIVHLAYIYIVPVIFLCWFYRVLGRDRLKIQIRKLNKVSSYLIDHTVLQIQ